MEKEDDKFILRVIASFRVTLPNELREKHDIAIGDFVELQFVRKINTEGEGKKKSVQP